MEFTIKNRIYSSDIYVTKTKIGKIIFGQDFIFENRHLLIEKLKEFKPSIMKRNKKKKLLPLSEIKLKDLDTETKNHYKMLFKDSIEKTQDCNIIEHKINTINERPIKEFNFRIPIHLEVMIDKEIAKLLKNGIIETTYSEWNSKLVPIIKKDKSLRLCIDFRPLNNITIKESYPIPLVDDILIKLKNSTIFSCLDATSGYHQILLNKNDIKKTAFTWKRKQYQFLRMPFGLCNAPSTFQMAMDRIFCDEPDILCYLDDIILKSRNIEEHKNLIERAMLKLKSAGIYLNAKKCCFYQH